MPIKNINTKADWVKAHTCLCETLQRPPKAKELAEFLMVNTRYVNMKSKHYGLPLTYVKPRRQIDDELILKEYHKMQKMGIVPGITRLAERIKARRSVVHNTLERYNLPYERH